MASSVANRWQWWYHGWVKGSGTGDGTLDEWRVVVPRRVASGGSGGGVVDGGEWRFW